MADGVFVSAAVRLLCMIWRLMRIKCYVLIGQTAGCVSNYRVEDLFLSLQHFTLYTTHTGKQTNKCMTLMLQAIV